VYCEVFDDTGLPDLFWKGPDTCIEEINPVHSAHVRLGIRQCPNAGLNCIKTNYFVQGFTSFELVIQKQQYMQKPLDYTLKTRRRNPVHRETESVAAVLTYRRTHNYFVLLDFCLTVHHQLGKVI